MYRLTRYRRDCALHRCNRCKLLSCLVAVHWTTSPTQMNSLSRQPKFREAIRVIAHPHRFRFRQPSEIPRYPTLHPSPAISHAPVFIISLTIIPFGETCTPYALLLPAQCDALAALVPGPGFTNQSSHQTIRHRLPQHTNMPDRFVSTPSHIPIPLSCRRRLID